LALREFHLHLGREDERDLVLDREDVVDRAVIPLGPDVRAVARVDQLRGHANAVASLAHAAFENVTSAEFPRHFAKLEFRAITLNPGSFERVVIMSSTKPSTKNSWLGSSLIF